MWQLKVKVKDMDIDNTFKLQQGIEDSDTNEKNNSIIYILKNDINAHEYHFLKYKLQNYFLKNDINAHEYLSLCGDANIISFDCSKIEE